MKSTIKTHLLSLLIVAGFFVTTVVGSEVQIAASNIPNANFTGLGANVTGTASCTNGSTAVTFSSAVIPARYVGVGGYQISLGGTYYFVASTESTSGLTLAASFAGSTSASVAAIIPPAVLLRVFSNQPFTPLGTSYVIQPGSPGQAGGWFKQIACTVRPISGIPTAILPEITLPATTDPAINLEKQTRLTAWFFRLDGSQLFVYGGFDSFRLPPTPSPTTWPAIRMYNTPNIPPPLDNATYSREQVNALIPSVSGTPDYLLKSNAAGTGANSAAAYQSSGNITFTGQTDLAGGVPNKTAVEIAALSPGNEGRLFYQTDGLKGFYRDYGPSVGIKRMSPHVDVYEFGFIPNDSSSTTRTANSAAWVALMAAIPSRGARIVFPEERFYFAEDLEVSKLVMIEGAGAGFQILESGTRIYVESGQNGFTFLNGASGSSLRNLSIMTRSGYSGVSTGDGVYSDVTIKLDNLFISGFGRDGVYFEGTAPANTDWSSIKDSHALANKRDGFHMNGGGDTNLVLIQNCNSYQNGRHGFYNVGASNTYIGTHADSNAQVTAGSYDYYDNGTSCNYFTIYSEASASAKIYLDSSSIYNTFTFGLFGAPEIVSSSPGINGDHVILDRGRHRTLRLRDSLDAGGGLSVNFVSTAQHLYMQASGIENFFDYNSVTRVATMTGLSPTTFAPVVVTPSQITSNQNNYAPSAGGIYRLSSDASRTVTGWAASAVNGTTIALINVGSNDITLSHESASSTAANRFTSEYGLDVVLTAGARAEAIYDTTTSRWRLRLL